MARYPTIWALTSISKLLGPAQHQDVLDRILSGSFCQANISVRLCRSLSTVGHDICAPLSPIKRKIECFRTSQKCSKVPFLRQCRPNGASTIGAPYRNSPMILREPKGKHAPLLYPVTRHVLALLGIPFLLGRQARTKSMFQTWDSWAKYCQCIQSIFYIVNSSRCMMQGD